MRIDLYRERVAMEAQDGYVELDGGVFHYLDWGGQGRAMLLLHGLASNAHFWDLSAPYFLHEFRVLALDQRGHGESAKPEDGYDSPTVAGDVAQFIQRIGLERPVLVGHSWGGNVGIQVAADYDRLLTGLVCIDGGAIEPSAREGATWEEVREAMEPPDFATMKVTFEQMRERVRSRRFGSHWGEHWEAFARANFDIMPDGTILPKLRREKHMLIARAIWDQQVSTLYPRVRRPVLLMPARSQAVLQDSAGRVEEKERAVEKALRLLPKARVVWMEDSIHDVPVQRPAEVVQVIREHVRDGFLDS